MFHKEEYIECPKCGYVGPTSKGILPPLGVPLGCLLSPILFIPNLLFGGKLKCPKCGCETVKRITKAEYESLLK
jgi:DNA-directed RNA polymerase subunit RPC12/RpoP